MISTPAQMNLYPDIKVIKHFTADKTTGDGVFEDTDLVRIPWSGWLLVNVTTTATGDSLLYVPQLRHQENRSNHIPVLNAGVAPACDQMLSYKIWVEKGDTPRILFDEVSDTATCVLGAFFKGRKNPVGKNTPDVLVVKQVAATTQNVLADTDLEDFPFPGYLLVWSSSDQVDSQIQINQAGHQTGNYSLMPSYASGLSVDISKYPPFKTYVPSTGNPTVTVTEVTSMASLVVCAFYVDWANVPQNQIRRLGL